MSKSSDPSNSRANPENSEISVKKGKKSHKRGGQTASTQDTIPPQSEVSSSSDDLVQQLVTEIKALQYRLAVCEGFDVVKRFRHHLMYDLVKKFQIDVPPKMNTKKRTNFPILLKAIEDAGSKIPSEWLNAIRGLKTLEKTCQFPMGFWDSVDNSTVTDDLIESFVANFDDPDLKSQIKDMCHCSLVCTPPCARGNGNSPKKGSSCETMQDVQVAAKTILQAKDEKSSKKKSKETKV